MTTRREKILQKLNPKLLKMTPKLSGDEGSFIDLDSDDSLVDGAKNLMMRFFRNQDLCEKNKRNLLQSVTELTISNTRRNENNEICEVISEKLSLPFTANEEEACERPGRRLQKLKMELQEKMSAKWEEEYKKRVNENKIGYDSKHKHQKKYSEDEDDENNDDGDKDHSDDDDDDGGGDGDSDNDSKSDKNSDAGDDENEGVIKGVDEESCDNEYEGDEEDNDFDKASVVSDEENSKNNYDENQENKLEKDDEYDEGDGCSLVPAYQPGGGMLFGGSELTQTEDCLPQNLLSPSLRLSMNELSCSKLPSQDLSEGTPKKVELSPNEEVSYSRKSNKLFSQAPNDSFDLNEAFEFCSGKFPDADPCGSQLVAENVVEESINGSDDNENDECGGGGGSGLEDKFQSSLEGDSDDDSQPEAEGFEKEISKARRNIIAFEDSEEEEEQEKLEKDTLMEEADESQSAGQKLLSDDEEEGTEENRNIKKKRRKNLHFSDEEDATNDSEEEKENESGNSDEEDVGDECEERSVHYDSEENEIINPREFFEKEAELSGEEWSGDEDERGLDEFDVEEGDADKLDDDKVRSQLEKIHIRRVLDDDAREVRLIQEILFEDGDLHSDGKRRDRKFKWKNLGTFDEQGNEGESKEEGGNSSEDENAEEEEWRKIRHEKELFLMTKKKDGDISSDEEIVEDFHAVKVTSVKTTIKLPGRNENVTENSKTTTDHTVVTKTTTFSQNARGSFLTRNEEFLSRLAKATSSVTDNVLGPKSSKNFVFATKSPEKTNPDRTTACKRQVEDSGSCSGRDKKIKLLPPRIDTGPSILDLLA